MPTPYERGRSAEYSTIEELRHQGFSAQRTAGSKGPFDIIAWDADAVLLIQVKRIATWLHTPTALARAADAWADRPIPHIPNVTRQVWIRCKGLWSTYPLE